VMVDAGQEWEKVQEELRETILDRLLKA